MGDALKQLLGRKRQEIKITARQAIAIPAEDLANNNQTGRVASKSLSRRQLQMKQIKQWHNEGVSIRSIAQALKVS
ncbi:MAG: hypothetical protein ABIQ00_13905, partial [Chitinophagaceae bacterium]